MMLGEMHEFNTKIAKDTKSQALYFFALFALFVLKFLGRGLGTL